MCSLRYVHCECTRSIDHIDEKINRDSSIRSCACSLLLHQHGKTTSNWRSFADTINTNWICLRIEFFRPRYFVRDKCWKIFYLLFGRIGELPECKMKTKLSANEGVAKSCNGLTAYCYLGLSSMTYACRFWSMRSFCKIFVTYDLQSTFFPIFP